VALHWESAKQQSQSPTWFVLLLLFFPYIHWHALLLMFFTIIFSSYMWELVQNTKVLTSLKIRHYLSMENPLILVSCEKTVLFAYICGYCFKISWQSHHQMTCKKEEMSFFLVFAEFPVLAWDEFFFYELTNDQVASLLLVNWSSVGTWNISAFHMHVQNGISETTPSWILSSQILNTNRAEMSAMTLRNW